MKLKRKERKRRILQQAKNKMKDIKVKHEILPLLKPEEEAFINDVEDKSRTRVSLHAYALTLSCSCSIVLSDPSPLPTLALSFLFSTHLFHLSPAMSLMYLDN
jgi:hypothetical protein